MGDGVPAADVRRGSGQGVDHQQGRARQLEPHVREASHALRRSRAPQLERELHLTETDPWN